MLSTSNLVGHCGWLVTKSLITFDFMRQEHKSLSKNFLLSSKNKAEILLVNEQRFGSILNEKAIVTIFLIQQDVVQCSQFIS